MKAATPRMELLLCTGLAAGLLTAAPASTTYASAARSSAVTPTVSSPVQRPARPSDFDGDGYADLAVGAPGDEVRGLHGAGSVTVLYGSRTGLTATRAQQWNQHSPGIDAATVADAEFGASLATADFDRDGYSELAIGPCSITVLRGSASGVTGTGAHTWTAAEVNAAATGPSSWWCLGRAMATGDFDHDGYPDLAASDISTSPQDGREQPGSGVTVLYGGPHGLSTARVRTFTRASLGLPLSTDAFGESRLADALAAGDLKADGYADLAIGVPTQRVGTVIDAGVVVVLYGGPHGLSTQGRQVWSQDSPGILDRADQYGREDDPQWGDEFGAHLAIANLGHGRAGDLVVGVPRERIRSGSAGNGAVSVIYGSAYGLRARYNQFWHLDRAGVPGVPRWGDNLGSDVAAGDLTGDGWPDLVASASGRTVNGVRFAGALLLLRGGPHGLTSSGAQLVSQATRGVPGVPVRRGYFGAALSVAQYGRSPNADVVARTYTGFGITGNAGKVTVLYGGRAGITTTAARIWSQNSYGVPGTSALGDRFGAALTP